MASISLLLPGADPRTERVKRKPEIIPDIEEMYRLTRIPCYRIELETVAYCTVKLPKILALQESRVLSTCVVLQNSQEVDMSLQPLMAVACIAFKVERTSQLLLPTSVSLQRADIAEITTICMTVIFGFLKTGLGEVVFDSKG